MMLLRRGVSWLMVGTVLAVLVGGLGPYSGTGAQEQEIEVCPRYVGSCPYTSIAAAVRDAPDGATIVIWAAGYTEPPIEITKALTFKVKKRGMANVVNIFPTLGGNYPGLFKIAVDNKDKWVQFLGDSETSFSINGGSDAKTAVFYIQSNARFDHVVVSGRGGTEAVIYAQLWEGMTLEFFNGEIGGGKEWGLVNLSNPKSDVTVINNLIHVNEAGAGNFLGNFFLAKNHFISNGTGVYVYKEGWWTWINNNTFEKNGTGIYAESSDPIRECKGNVFINNGTNMNSAAAEVCR